MSQNPLVKIVRLIQNYLISGRNPKGWFVEIIGGRENMQQ